MGAEAHPWSSLRSGVKEAEQADATTDSDHQNPCTHRSWQERFVTERVVRIDSKLAITHPSLEQSLEFSTFGIVVITQQRLVLSWNLDCIWSKYCHLGMSLSFSWAEYDQFWAVYINQLSKRSTQTQSNLHGN